MKTVHRNALVMHSAEQMYQLVNDIEAYPQFLPWCNGARIESKTSEEIVASLDVSSTPRCSFEAQRSVSPSDGREAIAFKLL